jgi:hypothetical protein
MKKLMLKAVTALALTSISATAFAYTDTAYFRIGRIEGAVGSSSGYRIYPKAGYALPTDQGCAKSDYAEMNGVTQGTVTEAIIMNNTLLAAFMSGRSVKLRLDGCGRTGRPNYRLVSMVSGQ